MPLFAWKKFDDSNWGRFALEHCDVYSYANVEYLSLSLVETSGYFSSVCGGISKPLARDGGVTKRYGEQLNRRSPMD